MAGKHTGAFSPVPDGSAAVVGFEWNNRTTKAYSEGRLGNVANGHPTGSDADLAYKEGATHAADGSYRFETAGNVVDKEPFTIGMTLELANAIEVPILQQQTAILALSGTDNASKSYGPYLAIGGEVINAFHAYAENSSDVTAPIILLGLYSNPSAAGPVDLVATETQVLPTNAPTDVYYLPIDSPIILQAGLYYTMAMCTGSSSTFTNFYVNTPGDEQWRDATVNASLNDPYVDSSRSQRGHIFWASGFL